jgi:hypothetical protein
VSATNMEPGRFALLVTKRLATAESPLMATNRKVRHTNQSHRKFVLGTPAVVKLGI